MDNFIVSARKYRPQTFDTVIGQAHITTTLKNAIKQSQLAHAFLFCGPRGVGKTTCARILAKTINCENQTPEGEACNTCPSCVSFNQGTSLNIHELDAASNNSVDDIRTLVDQVRFAPQAGKYKVYIVDEVHMLSASAFNAFLKTLEEPPSYAIFILATTEKHKILPTILSRCQIFDFKRITTNDTVEHLEEICVKENVKAEKAALQTIAQKSEGCMRDALSIMDKIVSFSNGELTYTSTLQHLNILDEDYYFKMIDFMLNQNLSDALLLFDEINQKGFEGDSFINGMAEFFRNLLVSKDPKAISLLDVVESFKAKYKDVAYAVPITLLLGALNILNEAEIGYRSAKNKRLHVELAIIKLCYLKQALEITETGNTVTKKKIVDTSIAVPFRQLPPTLITKNESIPTVKKTESAAKLIVEEPTKVLNPPTLPKVETKIKPVEKTKLKSIEKLRKQFKAEVPILEIQPIEQQKLQTAWNLFTTTLKTNKNPAAQSFELAKLKVLDENSFYIYTSSALEYRFIDSCKNLASSFLQKELSNTQLQFYIIKQENTEPKPEINTTLTTIEQWQRLIEKYPLIKELKEKLKLQLDR